MGRGDWGRRLARLDAWRVDHPSEGERLALSAAEAKFVREEAARLGMDSSNFFALRVLDDEVAELSALPPADPDAPPPKPRPLTPEEEEKCDRDRARIARRVDEWIRAPNPPDLSREPVIYVVDYFHTVAALRKRAAEKAANAERAIAEPAAEAGRDAAPMVAT